MFWKICYSGSYKANVCWSNSLRGTVQSNAMLLWHPVVISLQKHPDQNLTVVGCLKIAPSIIYEAFFVKVLPLNINSSLNKTQLWRSWCFVIVFLLSSLLFSAFPLHCALKMMPCDLAVVFEPFSAEINFLLVPARLDAFSWDGKLIIDEGKCKFFNKVHEGWKLKQLNLTNYDLI